MWGNVGVFHKFIECNDEPTHKLTYFLTCNLLRWNIWVDNLKPFKHRKKQFLSKKKTYGSIVNEYQSPLLSLVGIAC